MGAPGEFLAVWGDQERICRDQRAGPRQEMGCSHPSFYGAEWVIHGLSSNAHNVRLLLQTLLHGIDDGFMLPPFDATLPTGRALSFHRAARTVAGPIVAQGQPVLDVVEPPGQPFPGWAAILVVFDDVDKALLTEATLGLGTCGQRLWHIGD